MVLLGIRWADRCISAPCLQGLRQQHSVRVCRAQDGGFNANISTVTLTVTLTMTLAPTLTLNITLRPKPRPTHNSVIILHQSLAPDLPPNANTTLSLNRVAARCGLPISSSEPS